ncbi:hypothetical protein ACH4F2_09420, partial [Streptomyces sp. NPDC017890]
VLSDTLGTEITCTDQGADFLAEAARQIPQHGAGLYLESAVQKMRLAASGNLPFELREHDDVQTVLGRPGLTVAQWAKENLLAQL